MSKQEPEFRHPPLWIHASEAGKWLLTRREAKRRAVLAILDRVPEPRPAPLLSQLSAPRYAAFRSEGSSPIAVLIASSTRSRNTNSSFARASAGTSSRSFSLRFGQHHRLDAGAQRGERLLLHPADRQHQPAQRDLAGHRDVRSDRLVR